MYEHNMTWEEWTEGFFSASDWQIDRTGTSEEEAEARYPVFYAAYQNGEEPEDFYCQYFVSHERGEVEIWFDPDEPDDFDYELDAILSNDDFYKTFTLEIDNLKVLNNISVEGESTIQTLRRQIFVGAITCLETYLSDAFINTVLSNDKYLELFFKTFDFNKEKVAMNNLFETYKNAEEIATKKMKAVIYHNIPKVKMMYENTLDISFPEIEKICEYVNYRHDFVHRNGREKKLNGTILLMTKDYVDRIINITESFVYEIDKQLKEKTENN